MTDIIDRLENANYQNAPSRCFEAANEIKRLRGLITAPAQAASTPSKADISSLIAEFFCGKQSLRDQCADAVLARFAAQPPAASVKVNAASIQRRERIQAALDAGAPVSPSSAATEQIIKLADECDDWVRRNEGITLDEVGAKMLLSRASTKLRSFVQPQEARKP